MKKRIIAILIALVLTIFATSVYAIGNVDMSGGESSSTVNNLVGNIWTTLSIVIYLLAVGCIVFAGLRYMLSSADAKADIKKQTRYVTCGSMLSIWGHICYKPCICYILRD